MAYQANHLSGLDRQIQVADDRSVAVAKGQSAHLESAFYTCQLHGLRWLGHGRHMVQHIKNTLGASSSFLGDGHNPAHGIEPTVKAADVRDESGENANGDVVVGYLPDAESPYHQQTYLGHQRHGG